MFVYRKRRTIQLAKFKRRQNVLRNLCVCSTLCTVYVCFYRKNYDCDLRFLYTQHFASMRRCFMFCLCVKRNVICVCNLNMQQHSSSFEYFFFINLFFLVFFFHCGRFAFNRLVLFFSRSFVVFVAIFLRALIVDINFHVLRGDWECVYVIAFPT